jgi:hypothetical protein
MPRSGPWSLAKLLVFRNLKSGVVLTIERGDSRRAPRVLCSGGRVEPKAEVVHLDRIERGVRTGIRKRAVENDRRRRAALRERERLYAEATEELLVAAAVLVGHDVTLVPGHAKRRRRNLDHEEIEIRVGRQAFDRDVHDIDGTARLNLHRGRRVRKAAFRAGGNHHWKLRRMVVRRGQRQRRKHQA